jgi:hypothetical protein
MSLKCILDNLAFVQHKVFNVFENDLEIIWRSGTVAYYVATFENLVVAQPSLIQARL